MPNLKILSFQIKLKSYLFFLFFSTGLYGHSQALSAGDVAIIGLNCDPGTSLSKTFAVVALADLSANQVIKFSDKAYFSNAFSALLGNGSEGIFSWTIPAGGVGKGTVIMFTITSGGTPGVTTTPSTGTTTVIEGWTSTTANTTPFGQNGDGILIYQGLESSPTFIFGFNCGNNTTGVTNGWNTGLSMNPNGACELPSTLTSGTNAVGFGGGAHVDNFKYNGIQTGTKAAILAEIANTTKWVSDDVNPYDFTPGSGVFTGTQPIFTITAANSAPTALNLSSSSVNENVAANTTVGSLSSTDPDAANTFTYTLVSGAGSADNASFNISGSNLRITNSPDFETKSSYAVRVRTTDQGGLFFENNFTVSVNNVIELANISVQPVAVSKCEGLAAGFSVTATNVNSYQWQESANGVSFSNINEAGIYSGTTSSALSISSVPTSINNHKFRCMLTNSDGSLNTDEVTLTVVAYPSTDAPSNVTACNAYILPALTVGNYFTGSNGTGTALSAGNSITATQTLYVYAANGSCSNQHSFDVTIENCAQINPSQCGTTIEYLNTQYISAVPVSGAEQYEFKITNGAYTATATDNLQAGKVRLLQFAGYSYNTTYQMSVRAKTGGVWGSFGSACSITTTAAPHSEIDAVQCGTTLAAMNTAIYTSTVNGATQYRFRVVNGANVQTIDRPVRTFDMTMLANYAYGTTYTIDVAVEFDGTWHPYSTACNVTTPSLGSSVVLPSQCGTTLSSVSSSIFSTTVSGATQYRYRVTNGASVQTIDKPSASFKLTDLAAYSFATTYTVEVAVNYGGTWQAYGPGCNVITPAFPTTQVQASQCGTTLASMTTYIYASSVSNASAYRFRFTEGANVQTYVSTTRAMNVTQLATHKAFTTYTVEAAAQINGVWGDYGSACNITTPAVPAKIQSSQCGTTLTRVDKLIYADPIAFATQYRFRVTNGANVQTIDRATNSFYLTQGSYAYGTTYTIDVAVQYGGIWQPFSTACTVSTPAAGTVTTGLIASSCGLTLTANSQLLEAEKVVGAAQYEFLVENAGLSYSQSVVNAGYTFSMSQLTGLTAATTYTVKVRSKVNNIWSAYGTICNVTTSGTAFRQSSAANTSTAFTAYPNPSNGVFTISSISAGTYTILNEAGQTVQTIELTESNGNQVEVEGLMNGVYFVTGRVNGEQVTKKVAVVR